MPRWDKPTLARFAQAEAALVGRQLALAGETGQIWHAWRNVSQGSLSRYAELLVANQFEEVQRLAAAL